MFKVSQKISETQRDGANHRFSETQNLGVSRCIAETQNRSANQGATELQYKCVSHDVDGTLGNSANRNVSGTQEIFTSQRSLEDQFEKRRQRGKVWERRMRERFSKLKHPRLRILVESYYDMQKLRIATNNRLKIYEKFNMVTSQQAATIQTIINTLKEEEKSYERMVRDEVKGIPIFLWLKEVKGIGPVMAGGLIAWIDDIARFPTVSKLWAYAVGKPGERRQKGAKCGWNPRLKTHCWRIGTQLLRAKGRYADFYYQFKRQYLEREDIKKAHESGKAVGGKLSYKIHIHQMALRKMIKLFLSHLWEQWRKFEGLPIREPYSIEKLGHTTKIEPFQGGRE